jgi:FixJ family two-component response regulator
MVFIIDDDPSIRKSLSLFLTANDFKVEAYASSEAFLEREPYAGSGCILLDVDLEGKSGLELHEELNASGCILPVIFITGRGTIRMGIETMKKGAFNFLEKPFGETELLKSVSEAIALSQERIRNQEETAISRILINRLTPREAEVMGYLIIGMLNKQIGCEMDIAENTVKIHRHNIYEKLGVKSVPEIIYLVEKAGTKTGPAR